MFGLSLSDANIIHGFGAINIISLTFLAWCWCRISHNLKIGSCGLWLGFCGLFFSFAATKNAAYYLVLTDIPAMAIGGAMLVCYLESRPIPLLLLLGIGAFTWPIGPGSVAGNVSSRAAGRSSTREGTLATGRDRRKLCGVLSCHARCCDPENCTRDCLDRRDTDAVRRLVEHRDGSVVLVSSCISLTRLELAS